MKLRTAIKIVKGEECVGMSPILNWRRSQIYRAYSICSRHQSDERVPYIPSEEEEEERFCIMASMIASALIENEEEKNKIINQIWDS